MDEPGSEEGSRPVIKLLNLRGPARKTDWYQWAWDEVKREPINPTVLTRSELSIATWIQVRGVARWVTLRARRVNAKSSLGAAKSLLGHAYIWWVPWVQRLLEDCPVFREVVTAPRVLPLRTTIPGLG